jgi:ATP-dependent DNA helicase RecQ
LSRARVRLLATPERIRAELGGDSSLEIDLLRSMWRATRGRIAEGAVVDLDSLPPGLGGAMGAAPLLKALEVRQFLTWSRVGEGLVVADRSSSLERWPLDWETLDRRRRAETAQLDVMQKYAYTDRCRRGFVLRYFGDPAATASCQQCDNCLHLGHRAEVGEQVPATTRGARRPARAPASSKAKSSELRDLTADEQSLLDRLRSLRTVLARRDSVPAYVVFADRTLREMARERPRTPGALADVYGVGPAKMEKYGEAFLRAVREA